jgi:hypothetical protein
MPVLDEIAESAVTVGRATAVVRAVVTTIVALLVCGGGVYLVVAGGKEMSASAKVTSASTCTTSLVTTSTRNGTTTASKTQCYTPVAYNDAAGAAYTRALDTGTTKYAVGDSMGVYYQPNDAGGASAQKTPGFAGYAVIGFAVLVVLLAWGNYYLTRKSKFMAGMEGVGTVRDAVQNVFSKVAL